MTVWDFFSLFQGGGGLNDRVVRVFEAPNGMENVTFRGRSRGKSSRRTFEEVEGGRGPHFHDGKVVWSTAVDFVCMMRELEHELKEIVWGGRVPLGTPFP